MPNFNSLTCLGTDTNSSNSIVLLELRNGLHKLKSVCIHTLRFEQPIEPVSLIAVHFFDLTACSVMFRLPLSKYTRLRGSSVRLPLSGRTGCEVPGTRRSRKGLRNGILRPRAERLRTCGALDAQREVASIRVSSARPNQMLDGMSSLLTLTSRSLLSLFSCLITGL